MDWSYILRLSHKNGKEKNLRRFEQKRGRNRGTNISSFLLEDEDRRKTLEETKILSSGKTKRKDPAKNKVTKEICKLR